MQMRRPLAGLVIFDDVLTPPDLEVLNAIVAEAAFEVQDLGRNEITARERAVVEDPRIPEMLWARLGPHLPPVSSFFAADAHRTRFDPPSPQWQAVDCNPRSRIYRYPMGASFPEHNDEPWWRDNETRSFLTVLVYLGVDHCEGGETVVEGEVIAPAEGRVAVFEHGLRHEGRPVERGTKTLIRNDVLAQETKQ